MTRPRHDPISPIPFRVLLWSIPLSVFIHNLEEYPRIVAYAQRHGVPINCRQMGIAVALATILPIPLTYAALQQPTSRVRTQRILAVPALLAVNALTHLLQTIVLRDCSPGTMTGLGVNVPLAVYLYVRAAREGVLTTRELQRAALLGASAMAPAALVLQAIGWLLDRGYRSLTKGR